MESQIDKKLNGYTERKIETKGNIDRQIDEQIARWIERQIAM